MQHTWALVTDVKKWLPKERASQSSRRTQDLSIHHNRQYIAGIRRDACSSLTLCLLWLSPDSDSLYKKILVHGRIHTQILSEKEISHTSHRILWHPVTTTTKHVHGWNQTQNTLKNRRPLQIAPHPLTFSHHHDHHDLTYPMLFEDKVRFENDHKTKCVRHLLRRTYIRIRIYTFIPA